MTPGRARSLARCGCMNDDYVERITYDVGTLEEEGGGRGKVKRERGREAAAATWAVRSFVRSFVALSSSHTYASGLSGNWVRRTPVLGLRSLKANLLLSWLKSRKR